MWIFSRPLDALKEEDLIWLIANKVRETRTLDYKRQMYGDSTDEKRKMLRDVASMANAEGGVLVLGMDEDKGGTASELLPVPNADVEADRLIKVCNAFIAERILGLRTRLVDVRGGAVIVVYVPRSYRRPHMVTLDGRTDFWTRHDNGNGPMSVSEIKTAVTSTEDLEMKLERFLEQRRTLIGSRAAGSLTLAITATPLIVESGKVDINGIEVKRLLERIDAKARRARTLLLTRGYVGTPTLEGRRVDLAEWSLHVFRTGHVEFILTNSRFLLWPPMFSKTSDAPTTNIWSVVILAALCRIYDFVAELRELASISDPFAFTVNLWNCRGHSLLDGGRISWPEEHLILPPVIVSPDEQPDAGLRQLADLFWNAFGGERAPHFDAEGKLALPE